MSSKFAEKGSPQKFEGWRRETENTGTSALKCLNI